MSEASAKQKKCLQDTHQTHGMKRASLMNDWKSFDMVKGFCLDIMHALDEGVSRLMLAHLIDSEVSVLHSTRAQRLQMDRIWLAMRVPGHENRKPRSLFQYKQFKAHEIRMFSIHAIPLITKDVLSGDLYKLYCLLSNIAWYCSADHLSSEQAAKLKVSYSCYFGKYRNEPLLANKVRWKENAFQYCYYSLALSILIRNLVVITDLCTTVLVMLEYLINTN